MTADGNRDNKKNVASLRRMPKPMLPALVVAAVVMVAVAIHYIGSSGHGPDIGSPALATRPASSERELVLSSVDKLEESAARLGADSLSSAARKAANEQARDLLQAYLHQEPNDAGVRTRLAEVLFSLGETEQCNKIAEELLAGGERSANLLWLKGELARVHGKGGQMAFFAMAAESPDATPSTWSRYGMELMGQGDANGAAGYLQKAYDAGRRDGNTLVALAGVAMMQRRYSQAESFALEATRDAKAGPAAWFNLAEAQEHLGKVDAAANSMQQAVETERQSPSPRGATPGKSDLLMGLGRLRAGQGQWELAARAYADASDDPDVRPEAALGAAQAWYEAGRFAPAMKYIDIAARLAPGDGKVVTWLAKIEDARFSKTDAASQPSR